MSVPSVEALRAKAREAQDPIQAAEAFALLGEALVKQQQWREAAAALAEAARLAANKGRPDLQGPYTYGAALATSRVPGEDAAASQGFQEAIALARLTENVGLELQGRERLTQLELRRGNLEGALSELDTTLARVDAIDHPQARAVVLRDRAAVNQGLGKLPAALEDLHQATLAAERAQVPELALYLRIQHRALSALVGAGPREDFSTLLADAVTLDEPELRGKVRLARAAELLREGQTQAGLDEALLLRKESLETPDPIGYLTASMLVSEALESTGDRVGVLRVLLSTKATLERYYGKPAGQPVVLVLDSLEGRWGREVLAGALEGYRAWARERAQGGE